MNANYEVSINGIVFGNYHTLETAMYAARKHCADVSKQYGDMREKIAQAGKLVDASGKVPVRKGSK